MITGEQCILRGAGVDDAPFFFELYRRPAPIAALLDQRREWWAPTRDELSELFSTNQGEQTRDLYAVENLEGRVIGFAGVRTNQRDNYMGNFVMMLIDPADYGLPLADEVADFLSDVAFNQRLLRKVMSQSLGHETEHKEFLRRRGFESDGVQREVVYAQGCWHDVESFTLTSAAAASPPCP